MPCPVCDSDDVQVHRPAEPGGMLNPQNFKIAHDLECRNCRAICRPARSRLQAIGCVAAGLLLASAGGLPLVLCAQDDDFAAGVGLHIILVFGLVAFAGAYTAVYGLLALMGYAGKVRILSYPQDEPANGSLSTGGERGARQPGTRQDA